VTWLIERRKVGSFGVQPSKYSHCWPLSAYRDLRRFAASLVGETDRDCTLKSCLPVGAISSHAYRGARYGILRSRERLAEAVRLSPVSMGRIKRRINNTTLRNLRTIAPGVPTAALLG
jgi:hypothetical protein